MKQGNSGPRRRSSHLVTITRRETAESKARFYDPQQLRCLESVRISRERLENSDLLRLTEPRSGARVCDSQELRRRPSVSTNPARQSLSTCCGPQSRAPVVVSMRPQRGASGHGSSRNSAFRQSWHGRLARVLVGTGGTPVRLPWMRVATRPVAAQTGFRKMTSRCAQAGSGSG